MQINIKKMKAKIIMFFIINIIFILFVNMSFAKDKVIVEVTTIGFEKDIKNIIEALLINELEKSNMQIVNSNYYYKYSLNLVKLDQKIIITFKRTDAFDNIIYSKETTTTSIYEIDIIIVDLVKSSIDEDRFKSSDVKNVTDENSTELEKEKEKKEIMIGIGSPLAYLVGIKDPVTMYGLSIHIMQEIENYRVELDLIGAISSGKRTIELRDYNEGEASGFALASLGLSYFFIETNVSPFIGGGIGISYIFNELERWNNNPFLEDPKRAYKYNGVFFPFKIGVEFFRHNDYRVITTIQANFPAGENKEDGNELKGKPSYCVPMFFSLSFAYKFDYSCCCSLLAL